MTLEQLLDNEMSQRMLLTYAQSMLSENVVAFLIEVRVVRRRHEEGSLISKREVSPNPILSLTLEPDLHI